MSPRDHQIEPSPKKVRGLGVATAELRQNILSALDTADKPVTVRQAFYLVSSAGDVDKDTTGYRKVQRQLLAMRREGLVPYGWIADNTRWRIRVNTHTGLSDFLEESSQLYRRDLWQNAEERVEVWCEKDSIAGVLQKVTSEYRVDLLPARGYSSETFAYQAVEIRMKTSRSPILRRVFGAGYSSPKMLSYGFAAFFALPGRTFPVVGVIR